MRLPSRHKTAAEIIEEIEQMRGWSGGAFRRYLRLRERVKQLQSRAQSGNGATANLTHLRGRANRLIRGDV